MNCQNCGYKYCPFRGIDREIPAYLCEDFEQTDRSGILGNDNVKDYPPYLDYQKPRKPVTNADLLRSMTDEELAETFDLLTRTKPETKDDKQTWLDWLKEEVHD